MQKPRHIQRKTIADLRRQLRGLQAKPKFWGYVDAWASNRGKRLGEKSKVYAMKILKRERILKVCKSNTEAIAQVEAAKKLREFFFEKMKKELQKRPYKISFAKISLREGRVLVMKKEAGMNLEEITPKFLEKSGLSRAQAREAYNAFTDDLLNAQKQSGIYFDFATQNILVQGKEKDGRVGLVFIDCVNVF